MHIAYALYVYLRRRPKRQHRLYGIYFPEAWGTPGRGQNHPCYGPPAILVLSLHWLSK